MEYFNSWICFDINTAFPSLAVCLGLLSCKKVYFCHRSLDFLQHQTGFFLHDYHAFNFQKCPTSWCFCHHTLCNWCFRMIHCIISSTRHSILECQKVNLQSPLTRSSSSKCLLCTTHGFCETVHDTSFLFPVFHHFFLKVQLLMSIDSST